MEMENLDENVVFHFDNQSRGRVEAMPIGPVQSQEMFEGVI